MSSEGESGAKSGKWRVMMRITRLDCGTATLRRVIKRITESDTTVRVLPPPRGGFLEGVLITAKGRIACVMPIYFLDTLSYVSFCSFRPLKPNENLRSA